MDLPSFLNDGIFPQPLPADFRAIPASVLLNRGQEIVKLYKIVLNSKKVKEARAKFTLSEKDFISRFIGDDQVEIIQYVLDTKAKKRKHKEQKIILSKKINNVR